MTRPALNVYLCGELVGHLLDAGGPVAFQYVDTIVSPISASLPWRPDIYPASLATTRAVIEGWLPEERVRVAVARQLGVDDRDTYALLNAIGEDCAGAIQIFNGDIRNMAPSVRWLSEEELIETIEALPRAPLGPSNSIVIRSSLAGAQGENSRGS